MSRPTIIPNRDSSSASSGLTFTVTGRAGYHGLGCLVVSAERSPGTGSGVLHRGSRYVVSP